MNQSDSIGSLAKALCNVQSQLEGAKKDSLNPYFKAKYADLASVWDACRDLLGRNELAVAQTSSVIEGRDLVVDTTLMHSSGEWISGQLAVPLTKQDPQGIGSAITYARRYALSAIVGISPEDDDAEAATSRPKPAKPTKGELEKAIEKTEEREHWCYHHNVPFFKKGNMRGYAHKTEDGWCNEQTNVELAANKPPETPPEATESKSDREKPSASASVPDGKALGLKLERLTKEVPDIWAVDKIKFLLKQMGGKGERVSEMLKSLAPVPFQEFIESVDLAIANLDKEEGG